MDKVKQTVCESSEAFIRRLSDESEANDFDFYEFSDIDIEGTCLLYTSPSPRDLSTSRMPSSA